MNKIKKIKYTYIMEFLVGLSSWQVNQVYLCMSEVALMVLGFSSTLSIRLGGPIRNVVHKAVHFWNFPESSTLGKIVSEIKSFFSYVS